MVYDLAPSAVYTAAKTVRGRLKEPPKTVDEYIDTLAKQGMSKIIDFLKDGRDLI